MDLLRRRNMMQGGGDEPVFVDWIENVGDAMIIVPFSYRFANVKFDIKPLSGNMPNTTFLSLMDNIAEKGYSIADDHHFFLWTSWQRTSKVLNITTTANKKISVIMAYSPDAGDTGYYLGVNDGTWHYSPEVIPHQFNEARIGRVRSGHVNDYKFRWYPVTIQSIDTTPVDYFYLRPCLYHNEYGLWDTINNKFYGNTSGQGSFIGGYDE